jgi:hypothetical protein
MRRGASSGRLGWVLFRTCEVHVLVTCQCVRVLDTYYFVL